jgi:hypothetical protein
VLPLLLKLLQLSLLLLGQNGVDLIVRAGVICLNLACLSSRDNDVFSRRAVNCLCSSSRSGWIFDF